jgi:uncharacterized protein YdeI (YjbR/CyaY-like superfamily)
MSDNTKPQKLFKTQQDFENWLAVNHDKSKGIHLIRYKKSHPSYSACIEYEDAIQTALTYGWVDSVLKPVDEHTYTLCFTPRRKKSFWSSVNKKRIAQLEERGLMKSPGLRAIMVAKKNGSWESLDAVENLEMPDLMRKALETNGVLEVYESLSMSKRKSYLYRLNQAKRKETKEKRISETVEELREIKSRQK